MFTSNKEWTVFLIKGAVELPDKTFKLGYDILTVKVTIYAEFWSPVLNQLDSFFAKYVTTELAYPEIKVAIVNLLADCSFHWHKDNELVFIVFCKVNNGVP